MKKRRCWPVLPLLLASCGTPGRPVGLPPPEYEEPHVEPWPTASAEPANSSAPPASTESVGVEPAPEAPAGPPENGGGTAAATSSGR
jgi:hypothetical protein